MLFKQQNKRKVPNTVGIWGGGRGLGFGLARRCGMGALPPHIIATDGEEAAYQRGKGVEQAREPAAPIAHVQRMEKGGAVFLLFIWWGRDVIVRR